MTSDPVKERLKSIEANRRLYQRRLFWLDVFLAGLAITFTVVTVLALKLWGIK